MAKVWSAPGTSPEIGHLLKLSINGKPKASARCGAAKDGGLAMIASQANVSPVSGLGQYRE